MISYKIIFTLFAVFGLAQLVRTYGRNRMVLWIYTKTNYYFEKINRLLN